MGWYDDDDAPRTRTKARTRDVYDEEDLEVAAPIVRVDGESGAVAQIARLVATMPPRDPARILEEARAVGARLGAMLDAKGEGTGAFYRWSAREKGGGKSVIEGPTVGLMDALAQIWGGLFYQVTIVDQRGPHVRLRGYVLDVVRVVGHEREYRGWLRPPPPSFAGEERGRWETMQLQAAASKAVRGVLEHVIPADVVDAAMDAARDAAAHARLGGEAGAARPSLSEAVTKTVAAFGRVGFTDADVVVLERWLGAPRASWTALHLQEARGVYKRARAGELTREILLAEAAEREAGRAADAAEAGDAPATATSDRLASVGLGSSSSPSSTASGVSGASGPPDAAAGAAGTGTASGASGADRLVTPEQEARARLVAELRAVEARLPAAAVRRAKVDHSLSRIVEATVDVGKLRGLVADLVAQAETHEARLAAIEDGAWNGPRGVADLTTAFHETAGALGDQAPAGIARALQAAGIPSIDGASEAALRMVLHVLLEVAGDQGEEGA